jgi:hypothetical protein
MAFSEHAPAGAVATGESIRAIKAFVPTNDFLKRDRRDRSIGARDAVAVSGL